MYHAKHLSPMLPSLNIPKTVSFFTDFLDFEVIRDEKTYVILEKDNLTIHILRAGDIGEMEFYLEVDDLESVWQKMKDKLEEKKAKPPFNQDYGMREIHIEVPETKTLMFIGQPI